MTGQVNEQVLACARAFMGAAVFAGMTCRALAAGVFALGLAVGEIENSRPRVMRMIASLAVGGDAFADKINAFDRKVNLGHRLSSWLAAEAAPQSLAQLAARRRPVSVRACHGPARHGGARCRPARTQEEKHDGEPKAIQHMRDKRLGRVADAAGMLA